MRGPHTLSSTVAVLPASPPTSWQTVLLSSARNKDPGQNRVPWCQGQQTGPPHEPSAAPNGIRTLNPPGSPRSARCRPERDTNTERLLRSKISTVPPRAGYEHRANLAGLNEYSAARDGKRTQCTSRLTSQRRTGLTLCTHVAAFHWERQRSHRAAKHAKQVLSSPLL